ncbi:hypothetical protein [Herbaspirillum huttiense]|uniref:Uncharacterized protein n=2 Tax=Herbaspirillum huttiense TaxID=863372 RepID=A0AAJ2H9E5_9BURK|nr:hypothetical protein [Herbaspirillum huttiense]MDR9835975.1 hypothetical protein [Herbaspirillum huttiense]
MGKTLCDISPGKFPALQAHGTPSAEVSAAAGLIRFGQPWRDHH